MFVQEGARWGDREPYTTQLMNDVRHNNQRFRTFGGQKKNYRSKLLSSGLIFNAGEKKKDMFREELQKYSQNSSWQCRTSDAYQRVTD